MSHETDTRDPGDVGPGFMDAVGLTIREGIARYVIGFVIACALTTASFYVLNTSLIWGPGIPVALVVLAVAQISVHLVFFLHITDAARWRLAIDDRDAFTSTPRAALIVAIDRGFESPARKIFGWPWSCLLARRAPNILINENPVLVVWDEQGRPWFECRCGRRVKHTYLDELACRTCCRLDYASRHLHRQVPGVHRIMRWRRMIGRGIRRGRKRQAQRPAATRRRDGAGQEAQGHPAGGEA